MPSLIARSLVALESTSALVGEEWSTELVLPKNTILGGAWDFVGEQRRQFIPNSVFLDRY